MPTRHSFRKAWMVFLHDFHLSTAEPPRRKFNGAQQFAYTGVVLRWLGSLLTGLAIYKPTQLAWLPGKLTPDLGGALVRQGANTASAN
jgi:thiosulfate reductase cytochrome b subunit